MSHELAWGRRLAQAIIPDTVLCFPDANYPEKVRTPFYLDQLDL